MNSEYCVTEFNPGSLIILNKLGEEGWEAVAIDDGGWVPMKRANPKFKNLRKS
jgi:hypothetical protein